MAHMRRMMCPVWTTSNAKYVGTQFTKSSYTMCSVAPISYSIMRTNGTIGVDLLAHTALMCHVSVMLLCLFAFRRFLPLTKAKTVPELSGPTSPTPKNIYKIGFLKFIAFVKQFVSKQRSPIWPQRVPRSVDNIYV